MNRRQPGHPMPWTSRSFHFDHPAGTFPAVVERFRGAVPRLADILTQTPGHLLRQRPGRKWCILQHAGHLLELETLGEIRLNDFREGKTILTPADMENRRTEAGGYETADPIRLARDFRDARYRLADSLAVLTPDEISRRAYHGRLDLRLRLIDWVCFMCEHDDHHLSVMRALGGRGNPG